MRSRGLLVVRARADLRWFLHQTQFEHAAARAVAGCGVEAAEALATFVAEDPHDLLVGEVASQLIMLAGRATELPTTADVAERMLTGWLRDERPGRALIRFLLDLGSRVSKPSALTWRVIRRRRIG